jgi:hypothetical protein
MTARDAPAGNSRKRLRDETAGAHGAALGRCGYSSLESGTRPWIRNDFGGVLCAELEKIRVAGRYAGRCPTP